MESQGMVCYKLNTLLCVHFLQMINSEHYHTYILEPFLIQLNECKMAEAWFQQDGATAHTAHVSLPYLVECFIDHISYGI